MISVRNSIMSTIGYFSIFKYPLLKSEIEKFIHYQKVSQEVLEDELNGLIKEKIIFVKDGYYGLEISSEVIHNRISNNKLSISMIHEAIKIVKYARYIPFVKAIFLSGSVSKYNADPNADLDFLVITSSNRSCLCAFIKSLFLFIFAYKRRSYFCFNFFMSESNLRHPIENIYTATEVSFLIPLSNIDLCKKYFTENDWVKEYYINYRDIENQQRFNIYKMPKVQIFWDFISRYLGGSLLNKLALKFYVNKINKNNKSLNKQSLKLVNTYNLTDNYGQFNSLKFQSKIVELYDKIILNNSHL